MRKRIWSGISVTLMLVSLLAGICRTETEYGDTRVYVDPPTSSGALGSTFSVDIVLEDVTNLWGWEFKLFWDNSILECITVVVHVPSGFNWDDPNRFILGPGTEQDYNTTHGRYYKGLTALPMQEPHPIPFDGTTTLVTLVFNVTSIGETKLDLQESLLADYDGSPISHLAEDGYFINPQSELAAFLEAPVHVFPGEPVLLNATVVNGGTDDETNVELQLLINGSIVDSKVISFLPAGSSYRLSYLWTPIVEATYNITAYVVPVPDEPYTLNNMKSMKVFVSYAIRVPLEYPTIQEAINAASDGHTIHVASGTYYEHVVVNKTVSLIGEDRSTTIIDGSESDNGYVVQIVASDVEISGFKIQNGEYGLAVENSEGVNIINNTVSMNELRGIYISHSSDCILRNNNINDNLYNFHVFGGYVNDIDSSNMVDGRPIYYLVDQRDKTVPTDAGYVGVIDSINITVRDLNLANNVVGVLFFNTNSSLVANVNSSNHDYGIWFLWSCENSIINNTITNNGKTAILLTASGNNTVTGNTIMNNNQGIAVNWHNNTFSDNKITNSSRYGIHVYGNNNTINGNIITNSGIDGIYLWASWLNRVVGNLITNNSRLGILLERSSGNIIANNTASHNGLGGMTLVLVSNNNTVVGNKMTKSIEGHGIYVNTCSDNILKQNNMTVNLYNFGVSGPGVYYFLHSIDTSNTVDGKPIYYWVNRTNKSIPADAGFVAAVDCANITVRNLNLAFNVEGVLFAGTTDSTVENLTVSDNAVGIALMWSANNTICRNLIKDNLEGIDLVGELTTVNTFFHNDFIDNSRQIILFGSGANAWDNGVEGNYWSDYTGLDLDGDGIGDTPLWMNDVNVDMYPLMSPWGLLLCDINFDGSVDVYDVITAVTSFGATPEHPYWNPDADMNKDNIIDIYDLVSIAKDFGKTA